MLLDHTHHFSSADTLVGAVFVPVNAENSTIPSLDTYLILEEPKPFFFFSRKTIPTHPYIYIFIFLSLIYI